MQQTYRTASKSLAEICVTILAKVFTKTLDRFLAKMSCLDSYQDSCQNVLPRFLPSFLQDFSRISKLPSPAHAGCSPCQNGRLWIHLNTDWPFLYYCVVSTHSSFTKQSLFGVEPSCIRLSTQFRPLCLPLSQTALYHPLRCIVKVRLQSSYSS